MFRPPIIFTKNQESKNAPWGRKGKMEDLAIPSSSKMTESTRSKRKRGESTIYNIPTSNSYSIFSDDDEECEMDTIIPEALIFPPIIVNSSLTKHKEVVNKLKLSVSELNIKYAGNKTIFYVYNSEDFDTIKNELKILKLNFHTYTPKHEIKPKVVLKGMPPDYTTEDIQADLSQQGLEIYKIIQMVKKTDGKETKLPLSIIILNNQQQLEKLKNIKYCSNVVIRWEKYASKKILTQCHLCQEFNHVARNCFKKPKCLKCSEEHLSRDCPNILLDDFVPKCCNCQENHFSNSDKCPHWIRNQQIKLSKQRPAIKPPKRHTFNPKPNEFPSLPKTDSKWFKKNFSDNTMENSSKSDELSIMDCFKEFKNILKLFNINTFINKFKNIVSEVKNAEDSMSKIFIVVEGLLSLID